MPNVTSVAQLYPTPKWLNFRFDGLLASGSGFPATFGLCDDCGEEEYLQPDMCNLAIAGRICEDCYKFRNRYGRRMAHEKWQSEVNRRRARRQAKIQRLRPLRIPA